ncbi:MAG: Maebl, partial [Flavobacteriales bacterium]|nr:Maebl [Flavobacteriales bacterium]
NYGFEKLTPLIKSIEKFEVEQRENHKSRHKLIYVRIAEKKPLRAKK